MMVDSSFKRSEYALDINFLNDMKYLDEEYKKRILMKKNELEQKLSSNQLMYFIEHLNFGCELYKFMKERLQAVQLKVEVKYSYSTKLTLFLKHIKSIYEKVLVNFKHEEEIYQQYYKFCEWTSFKESSRACVQLYKYHENNDEMYCLASKWYLLDRKDYNFSIELLKQRWEKHKDKTVIFNQLVQFEILKDISSGNENFLSHMKKRFSDMILYVHDFQEYCKLITWMESVNNTFELQKMLIKLMKPKFADNYNMWDFLAMREKKGFHEGDENDLTFPKKVNLVINKYEEGMSKLSKGNKCFLWELFMSFLEEVVKEEPTNNEVKVNVLMTYEKADKLGYISEEGFGSWVELMPENKKLKILNLGIIKYPQSVSLWKQKFQLVIASNKPHFEVINTFESVIANLKEKSGEIWMMMLRYHILNSSYKEICAFFESVSKQSEEITYHLRVKYIIWLLQNETIEQCRKAYRKFVFQKPYSKELYKTICSIELSQIRKSPEDLMFIYKLGCEQFGNQCIDVWLDYGKFILYIYDCTETEREAKLKSISDSANKSLPHCLYIDFELMFKNITDRHLEMSGKIKDKV